MYFTQEDYIKIQKWLVAHSVKNEEFPKVAHIEGDETISIMQNGNHKKISIKELSSQLSNLRVEDIINLTANFESSGITIEDAIRLVPDKARQEGQIITFKNKLGYWEIYQFTGTILQWNNVELWNNPFDWEKLIVNSIMPDEEDVTKTAPDDKGNSKICFKDREYSPLTFSGLGNTILRKNIHTINDPIYGLKNINLLTQKEISKSNTIYEIRYDFDLNGEVIVIPTNCILEFKGGSISNGSIILQGTKIYPNGLSLTDHFIDCAVTGTYADGQCLFKKGAPRWHYNGIWYAPVMEPITE